MAGGRWVAVQDEQSDRERGWLESGTAQWIRAMRWQRTVTAAVAPIGLKFNEWLVLATTLQLTRDKGDAVSQSDVCRALGLTRMQVSAAMRALADAGLVDRGPDEDGWMWRVFVTRKGEARVGEARARAMDAAQLPPPRRAGCPGSPRIAKVPWR